MKSPIDNRLLCLLKLTLRVSEKVEIKKISETFTKEEFECLKELKEEMGLTWHDFILELAEEYEKRRAEE